MHIHHPTNAERGTNRNRSTYVFVVSVAAAATSVLIRHSLSPAGPIRAETYGTLLSSMYYHRPRISRPAATLFGLHTKYIYAVKGEAGEFLDWWFSFLFFLPPPLCFFSFCSPFQEIIGVFRIFLVRCVIFFYFLFFRFESIQDSSYPSSLPSLSHQLPLAACLSCLLLVILWLNRPLFVSILFSAPLRPFSVDQNGWLLLYISSNSEQTIYGAPRVILRTC